MKSLPREAVTPSDANRQQGPRFLRTQWRGNTAGFHYVQARILPEGGLQAWTSLESLCFRIIPTDGESPRLSIHATLSSFMREVNCRAYYEGLLMGPSLLYKASWRRVESFLKDRPSGPGCRQLITTTDGFFEPVDIKSGPYGAVYVADLE